MKSGRCAASTGSSRGSRAAGLLWCRARRGSRSLARGTSDHGGTGARLDHPVARPARRRGRRISRCASTCRGAISSSRASGTTARCCARRRPRSWPTSRRETTRAASSRLSSLAKTVVAEAALRTTLDAVRALERRPTGTFFVELKEAADGVPAITEINAGRFPSGVTALLAMGKDNMVELFAAAAVGQPEDSRRAARLREGILPGARHRRRAGDRLGRRAARGSRTGFEPPSRGECRTV